MCIVIYTGVHVCPTSSLASAAVDPLPPLWTLPRRSVRHKHSSAHWMGMISSTGSAAAVPPHGT